MITIRASEAIPGIRPDQLLAYFRSEREAAGKQHERPDLSEEPNILLFPVAQQDSPSTSGKSR